MQTQAQRNFTILISCTQFSNWPKFSRPFPTKRASNYVAANALLSARRSRLISCLVRADAASSNENMSLRLSVRPTAYVGLIWVNRGHFMTHAATRNFKSRVASFYYSCFYLEIVASVAVEPNSSFFSVITRRKVVWNRRFVTTYRSHLQGSSSPRRSRKLRQFDRWTRNR